MSDNATARLLAAIDMLRVNLMPRMDRLQDQVALQQDAHDKLRVDLMSRMDRLKGDTR